MSIFRRLLKTFIEPVKWDGLKEKLTGRRYSLTDEDLELIWSMLSEKNYIVCTYRSTHLSTYFICAAHFLMSVWGFIKTLGKTKIKWGKFAHVLMNIEETETPTRSKDFILVEAIGKGTTRSEFKNVFNCDRVALLDADSFIEWSKVTETLLDTLNRPYDYKFNLKDNSAMSCVEYILNALKSDSTFADDFKDLIKRINLYGNLDPSMFYESSSFKVALMIDRTKKRGVKYVREVKIAS